MNDHFDSYCGIYCGSCFIRLAYIQNRTDCIPEPWKTECQGLNLECHGCKSDHVYPNCAKCNIRPCAQAKKVNYCFNCEEYPCEKFAPSDPTEHHPHYRLALHQLPLLKEKSLEEWLSYQNDRFTCKKCGNLYAWYEKVCHFCGEKVFSVVDELKQIEQSTINSGDKNFFHYRYSR